MEKSKYLIGIFASGLDLRKKVIVHAVEGWVALCEKNPGRINSILSTYSYDIEKITCPKCLLKLAGK